LKELAWLCPFDARDALLGARGRTWALGTRTEGDAIELCLPTAPGLPLWGTETSERHRFLGSSRTSRSLPVF
jgi:hypothetical protein